MAAVRTTKTASGAVAIQAVAYRNRKTLVLKHFGSAHNQEDITKLRQIAVRWIEQQTQQQRLFPPEKEKPSLPLVSIDKLQNLGFYYTFAYEVLSQLVCIFSLTSKYQMILDLVIIRLIQPASKVESFALLQKFFGISYERREYYRLIPSIVGLKETIEKSVIAVAKIHFFFDFRIVFYDVTTLYYESFTEDVDTADDEGNVTQKGLRKNGFSKDLKFNQPQIVIGLIVTSDGFPVSYEVFEGNTFEGDTFIPMIWQFKKRYTVETLTVVADAAMISFDNVKRLQEKQLSYIVGARLGNLTKSQIQTIHASLIGKIADENELAKKDGMSTRIETERGLLVCDFSLKRYQKEKREMEKQIEKAKWLLTKQTGVKRAKFLKNGDKTTISQVLNTALIEKTEKLLGIKGYYTNLATTDNKTIIEQYHNLWRVEQAFRIAKSDLQTRPLYHFKRETIEAHMLICFMALAVCKYMELKTKRSTKAILKMLMQVTDARILHTLTNEEIILRSKISTELEALIKKLSL